MNTPELIRRKREGGTLSEEELRFLIEGYLAGGIEEYQISALLMAVFFQGMTPDEAATLTRIMMNSGRTYDWSTVPGPKSDKHSTGGVGDKVSLILAPLVAAAGIVNPMVSGRGLGHSGGTLDKLDAVPGYRWNLSEKELKAQLEKVGCAIIGQTNDFVPADKRLYALRDVTATVESIPLICASILSKKAASGTESLAMDVKCGSGAFMESEEKARALAEQLVAIGTQLGLKTSALLTQMNQPLGITVGNALEVRESIDVLKGGGPSDTRGITIELCAEMLVLAGRAPGIDPAKKTLVELLDSGRALEKFTEWIEAQGGDPHIVDNSSLLGSAPDRTSFVAKDNGVIQCMNTRQIGVAANMLGAGRMKTTDDVDPAVGLEVLVNVGDEIEKGQELVRIHHRGGKGLNDCERLLADAVETGEDSVRSLQPILHRVSARA